MDKDHDAIVVVAENMCNILGIDSIKEIAANAYVNNIADTMPLLPVLAAKGESLYVLTAYLLWQNCIPHAIGAVVLANVGDQAYIPLPEIAKEDELGMLADITFAILSQPQLRQLANDAYAGSMPEVKLLVEKIADKNKVIHLQVASLLWQHSIPFSLGQKLLAVENVYANDAPPVEVENDEETIQLIDLLCTSFSGSEMKLIVKKAYADNTINIRAMVHRLFKKTKSRFYKTILLLRKYKIFIPNGLIILDRVNEYCNLNKNKYYIDLCIYKDIYGTIKTGNSSYRRGKRTTA